ncbi:MAG: exosome protein, partial [Methanomassiliicoccaceae archaeon]|nr:exosome protein [Methanomassiliicoccaceae archaeon]
MQGTFHWLRMRVFCYATEDEELVGGALAELAGVDEVERDEADSEHGNRILIFSCELLKQADVVPVFQRLGRELCEGLAGSLGDRVDEDCVLHLRLDKQELV